MKAVAADAEVFIDASVFKDDAAFAAEIFFGPAVGDAHLLGLAVVDGEVDGLLAAAGEDLFVRLLVEITEGEAGFEAAGVDVAVGFDGDL